MEIFHSSGLSVSFMRYFCAETHTHTHRPESLLSSSCLSHSVAPLSVVYIFCFFLSLLCYSLCFFHPLHAASHKLYQLLYAYNFILSSHTFYRCIDTTLIFLSLCWNVTFIRILSYQTDSNIAGFRLHYAITVSSGVFATVSYRLSLPPTEI